MGGRPAGERLKAGKERGAQRAGGCRAGLRKEGGRPWGAAGGPSPGSVSMGLRCRGLPGPACGAGGAQGRTSPLPAS